MLAELKKYAKDQESFTRLEEMFSNLNEKLERTEEQLGFLESAIRNDYDSIIITELELEQPGPRIVYVNDGFTRMTGYTKDEVLGKTPRVLQGPKTDRAILDRLKRRLIEGQAFFGHSINYRKDGSEFINQWDIHPLINNEGEVTHWVSYQRDVTEKKDTAKAIFNTDFDELLQRTEEFTIKFTSVDGEIQCKYLTEAYEDLTGLSKSVIFEQGISEALHAEDVELVEDAIHRAFKGQGGTEYCRYKTNGDEYISVLQSFKPIWDDAKRNITSVKSVAKLELKES
jgi:PAS domain S-box-containing protein